MRSRVTLRRHAKSTTRCSSSTSGSKQRQRLVELRRLEQQLAEARRLDAAARDRPETEQTLAADAVDAVKAASDGLLRTQVQIPGRSRGGGCRRERRSAGEGATRADRGSRRALAIRGIDVSAREEVQTASAQLAALRNAGDAVTDGGPGARSDPRAVPSRARVVARAGARVSIEATRFPWVVLVVLTAGIAWSIRWLVGRYAACARIARGAARGLRRGFARRARCTCGRRGSSDRRGGGSCCRACRVASGSRDSAPAARRAAGRGSRHRERALLRRSRNEFAPTSLPSSDTSETDGEGGRSWPDSARALPCTDSAERAGAPAGAKCLALKRRLRDAYRSRWRSS